eukprot:95166_1
MSTNRNSNYKYCPDYDTFLGESKQKLQERLTHHHNLREPLIHQAVFNTINEIDNLGYKTFIDEHIPDYKSSFINIEQINKYIYEWNEFDANITVKSVLFGIIALCCLYIFISNIIIIIIDIIYVKQNKLHTKSESYKYFMSNKHVQLQQQQPKTEISCFKRTLRKMINFYGGKLGIDTTGWIIRNVISELTEIVVQSQALLLYNGYNIFDTDHSNAVYLANRPYFVIIFAVILSFNCFGSGILWLSYALLPQYCHGLLFKLSIFCIDEFSDLFYTIFPFIVILGDEYNKNSSNILVLLGQLNMQSTLAFISAFIPLLLLCNKSLFTINSAKNALWNKYYKEWKCIIDASQLSNDKTTIYKAHLQGFNINASALHQNQGEIYDATGNLTLKMNKMASINWINNDKKRTVIMKQIMLSVMSLLYIIYGILILLFVTSYINNSTAYCSLIKESKYFGNSSG